METKAAFVGRILTALSFGVLCIAAQAQWTEPTASTIATDCTTPPCKVGIGTSSPYAHLQVTGTSAAPSLGARTAASASVQGSNDVDIAMGTDPAFPYGAWIQVKHNVITQAYPLLLQPAGGNVGIGTSNPTQKLEVRSSPDGNHAVLVSTPVGNFTPNAPTGGLRLGWKFQDFATNNVDLQIVRGAGHSDGAGLAIATSPNNTVGSQERMRITSTGNVGIGTTDPQHKLELRSSPDGNHAVLVSTPVGNFTPNAPTGGLRLGWKFQDFATNSVDLQIVRGAGHSDGAGLAIMTSPNNTSATVERVRITSAGWVGIGTSTPTVALEVNGSIKATSVIGATYQDVAEWVPVTGTVSPGTVVVVADALNTVAPSHGSYDTRVAGVVSLQPGLILGVEGPSKAMIATTGRVKVRVDASRGAINPGDLLVTSERPGIAMRSEAVDVAGVKMHRPGTLIGKALEPLDRGEGEILVLLSLQ